MPSLEDQIAGVQLIRACTSEGEFVWRGSTEDKRLWEELLLSGDDASSTTVSSTSPLAFALRLVDTEKGHELWLNVDYRHEVSERVQLSVYGPELTRIDLDRIKKFVEERHRQAEQEEFDNVVFDVFTAVQAYLAEEPIQEVSHEKERHTEETLDSSIEINREVKMSRVIFWSHHLKAPSKKKDMTAWCSELGLWGLVKSGYPGYLCFEGHEDDVEVIVRRIKALQWHAIAVKTEEHYVIQAPASCSNMNEVRQEAIGMCLLRKGHTGESHKESGSKTKWRTTMDEVESGKELVERLKVACVPQDEYRSALNLR